MDGDYSEKAEFLGVLACQGICRILPSRLQAVGTCMGKVDLGEFRAIEGGGTIPDLTER